MHTETSIQEQLANFSIGQIVLVATILTVLRFAFLLLSTPKSKDPAQTNKTARGLAELMESLTFAGLLVFLIFRPFFLQAFYIPSESMEPTLQGHTAGSNGYTDNANDRIFVNRMAFRIGDPQHGDIVVFKAPKVADFESVNRGSSPRPPASLIG